MGCSDEPGDVFEVVHVAGHKCQPMHERRRCDDRVSQTHLPLLAQGDRPFHNLRIEFEFGQACQRLADHRIFFVLQEVIAQRLDAGDDADAGFRVGELWAEAFTARLGGVDQDV